MNDSQDIIIYQSADGRVKIDVRLEGESIWLTQNQLASLYDTTKQNVSLHVMNIMKEGELDNSTVKEILTVQDEGERKVSRKLDYYNLDMIISLGYRINSVTATAFRQWATERLKEYMIKGFVMDDERLKSNGGGNYWKELLDRIRDIRSSEKVLYRQVLDLYATSVDYDPKSQESITFFKTVQNKLHYATNQQTAAEVINSRANADKDFMGLATFSGSLPILDEVRIAKNYLTQDELFRLNRLVSAFFDLAEIKAVEHTSMKMADWVIELDKFSKNYGKGVLLDAGSVSHAQAMTKATTEYRKYQVRTLSGVEKAYLEELKTIEKKVEKRDKK